MSTNALPPSASSLRLARLVIRFVLGAAIMASGVLIALALFHTRPEPPLRDTIASELTVATITTVPQSVSRVWTGYGSARSMQVVSVASQVAARVIDRPEAIEAGAAVHKGDLLIQLDPTDFQARLDAAQQLVAQARADLQALDADEQTLQEQLDFANDQVNIEKQELIRATQALENGASNVSEVERITKSLQTIQRQHAAIKQQLARLPSQRLSIKARIGKLQADVVLAKENLKRTRIESPIDGVLDTVSVEIGDLVQVGSPIATVVDLSRIEVPLKLPASAFDSVQLGDPVTLTPDSPVEHTWQGTIVRLGPQADTNTRSITAFVELDQPDAANESFGQQSENHSAGRQRLLLPGQFVLGKVVTRPIDHALLVPRRAVVQGAVYLATIDKNWHHIARKHPVKVLFSLSGQYPDIDLLETQWSVIDGASLPPDAKVIVTNLDSLEDGRYINDRPRPTRRDHIVYSQDHAEEPSAPSGTGQSGAGASP